MSTFEELVGWIPPEPGLQVRDADSKALLGWITGTLGQTSGYAGGLNRNIYIGTQRLTVTPMARSFRQDGQDLVMAKTAFVPMLVREGVPSTAQVFRSVMDNNVTFEWFAISVDIEQAKILFDEDCFEPASIGGPDTALPLWRLNMKGDVS